MRKLALFLIVLGFSFSLHADFVTGERAFSNKRYSEALQQFRPLAEAGDFRAQYYMAYMYLNGYGVTRNDALGLEYLQKSLDQNYHLAQALMGFLYSRGEVVPADYKKAISLYQKAADQGNTSAMLNLGVAYYLGDGVPRNLVRAVELLEKIPVDQQPAAGRYLGDIYMTRNAEKVDQAINAYRSAAAAGDLPSYVALAEIYQKDLLLFTNLQSIPVVLRMYVFRFWRSRADLSAELILRLVILLSVSTLVIRYTA